MRGIVLTVNKTFAAALRSALDKKGMTNYGLEKACGSSRSNIGRWLLGEAPPEPETITKIARALEADEDEMQALADIRRLGTERIARMIRHAPDVFEQALRAQRESRVLTSQEQEIVKQISQHGPLEGFDLGPDSYVWQLPNGERLVALTQALRDLGAKGAGRKAK